MTIFDGLKDMAPSLFGTISFPVSSYVEAEDTRPQTDIKELNARIARIVEHENKLRAEIDAMPYMGDFWLTHIYQQMQF